MAKTTNNVRVGLVDDHSLMLSALALLVDSMDGFVTAWTCDDPRKAVSKIEEDAPDVLVVDLSMPERSGLELIKDVGALRKDMPVLVLSMMDETLYAQRVLKAGARGYVMKEASNEQLEAALRRVVSGGIAVSPSMAERMIEAYSTGVEMSDQGFLDRLTDREFEVFQLVGECNTGNQIAEALGISPKTVDVHKSKIRSKLELNQGDSLSAFAIRWVETQRLTRSGDSRQ
ncbi:MAG: response regulator transcription factor [Verrucomicrobiales bacterium]|nr:response regulator transcription factor [Verrucomicrobiales bacterium]